MQVICMGRHPRPQTGELLYIKSKVHVHVLLVCCVHDFPCTYMYIHVGVGVPINTVIHVCTVQCPTLYINL